MEIWQIWAIIGFVFLVLEIVVPKSYFLVISGAAFFAGLAAYMFHNLIWTQIVAFILFLPIFYFALKPVSKRTK